MTDGTHLRVLLPKLIGIEAGAVRVESPSVERRMAGEAVLLDVT